MPEFLTVPTVNGRAVLLEGGASQDLLIAEKAASAPIGDYPLGSSIFSKSDSAAGYPSPQADLGGVVKTSKTSELSASQTLSVFQLEQSVNYTRYWEPGMSDWVSWLALTGHLVGGIQMWLTNVAPEKHIFLMGQNVSRTFWWELFALWGTSFGAGDGSTTFGMPDWRRRAPFGLDNVVPPTGRPEMRGVGNKFGEERHVLTRAELPNYDLPTSPVPPRGNNVARASGNPGTGGTDIVTINSGGSDMPHENLPPGFVSGFIVRGAT